MVCVLCMAVQSRPVKRQESREVGYEYRVTQVDRRTIIYLPNSNLKAETKAQAGEQTDMNDTCYLH